LDVDKERARLEKEKSQLEAEREKITNKLSNPAFAEKEKPEVVAKEQEKAKVLDDKLEVVQNALNRLKKISS
jgi:valyl-tRNA synthetase